MLKVEIDPCEGPVALTVSHSEPCIDSRLLAHHLGIQHKNVLESIGKYVDQFQSFGKVAFQTEPLPSGQKEKFALLNEDHSFLLLSLSRNTDKVVGLKVKLVKAFGEARRNRDLTQIEYLPTYRALHDEIHALAAGSQNEKFVHMNLNKLVNKTAGIGSGQREGAALPTKSMLVTAQMIAAAAMRGAADHKEGYAKAKAALGGLEALANMGAPRELAA